MEDKIYVTRPDLPSKKDFIQLLDRIWDSRILTNNGDLLQEFEFKLKNYLTVDHLSVYSNGTIALLAALKALNIEGEVITTPYSFVATSHAIVWNGLTPVFADIDPNTGNLDPIAVEKLITEKTSAIMPVHVYGNPCDFDAYQKLSEKYNLKLIYDAAHCFDVQKEGKSILLEGDLSVLSFHATKCFNTIEGGAIVSSNPEIIKSLDLLKNFGFKNELEIQGFGINGKMNELQAAFGILQLDEVKENINRRRIIYEQYMKSLSQIEGIDFIEFDSSYSMNYSYMPIIVTDKHAKSRDELYDYLKSNEVYSRRYFYPLISNLSAYHELPSSHNLTRANYLADRILCLPIYSSLDSETVDFICNLICD